MEERGNFLTYGEVSHGVVNG